jgi:hypothetical protein
MIGPIILLAALASPAAPATGSAVGSVSNYRPTSRATANATVTIRIMSGAQFGEGRLAGPEGGLRRTTQLTDANGTSHQAEILEFQ